jgi:hypothetical protein
VSFLILRSVTCFSATCFGFSFFMTTSICFTAIAGANSPEIEIANGF